MSRFTRHASRVIWQLLTVNCLLFTAAPALAQPATPPAKICQFTCVSPAGAPVPPPDYGLEGTACSTDSDCVARCEAACTRTLTIQQCYNAPLYTVEANQPHCVVNPAAAAPTAPGSAESAPVLRTPADFGYNNPLGTTDIRVIINRVIRTALGFVGALFLMMFIYGGALWMTAAGDEKKVQKAKTALVNAVIGMLVISFSYFIISFIFETATTIRDAAPETAPPTPSV